MTDAPCIFTRRTVLYLMTRPMAQPSGTRRWLRGVP